MNQITRFLKLCKKIYKVKKDKDLLQWIDFQVDEKSSNNQLSNLQRSILKRGTVVWVDFGINIGDEFSGKHPAIILRAYRNGRTAYFLPIDSGDAENYKKKKYCLEIPYINGFPKQNRYINAYRVQSLSTNRIDFNQRIGYLSEEVLIKVDEIVRKFAY